MILKNKVALVTGSSSGIGRGIAIGLAKEGSNVIVNYNKREKEAKEVVQEIKGIGRDAISICADVSNKEQVTNMVNKGWEEFGKIDILVNNSGIARAASIIEMEEDDWDKVLDVNLKGAFLCGQAVAKKMVNNAIKGKIINISSVNGFQAEKDRCNYNASKGGLNALTQSMAAELGEYGINVNAIAIGVVSGTNIDENFFGNQDGLNVIVAKTPIGRLGTLEDCSNLTVFLASDKSNFIQGEIIVLDGGLTTLQY